MKVAISEIKNNIPGPTVERRKVRIKSTIWNTRKGRAFNQNSRKEKNQKMENLFEKILKENFSNLVKEIDT